MIKKYFLDESGNTGDVTLAAPNFSFEEQRFFVLSCFGHDDDTKLDIEVSRLRKLHNIQSSELKFSSVRKKPRFMRDLLTYLHVAESPIMIEATDKRYCLCIILIESLIVPAVCPADFGKFASVIKKEFADRLAADIPDSVLNVFCEACHVRTRQSLGLAFDTLESWVTSMPQDEVIAGILKFLLDTKNDFREADERDMKAIDRFLPVPDATRNGKAIQILPHVYSMLHIYGRLNRFTNGDLSEILLYHDEQTQFDQALIDGMSLAESGIGENLPLQPVADFHFDHKASLSFYVSHSSIGIQVADLLAGMVAFGLKELSKSNPELTSEWRGTFHELLKTDDPERGVGTNIVAASHVAREFKLLRTNSA